MAVRKAVYAGSFDPLTNGHLWMIEQGSKLFDELIISIGIRPEKKDKYTFSLDERLEMIRQTTKDFPNITADHFENKFLFKYARQIGARYILRGIRNKDDYEDEKTMRVVNGDLALDIQTVFLMPPKEVVDISSGFVKDLVGPEGWEDVVRRYVPDIVYKKFLENKEKNKNV